MPNTAIYFAHSLFFSSLLVVQSVGAAEPIAIEVYGNHVLDDEAVIRMTGIEQEPTLCALEVKRRLQTSSLFSRVDVMRTEESMTILVHEKTTWFVIPYFSSDAESTIFGIAGGQASVAGDNGSLVGRAQSGTDDHEASVLLRDEFFQNSLWVVGASLDYEDSKHRVFAGRDVAQRTPNAYAGGSIQLGYHVSPYATLNTNTYIEQHRFDELNGQTYSGLQLSHRIYLDYGNYYVNEGLARGASARTYFEISNPASDFQFQKIGASAQMSVFLRGNFDWILRPKAEVGAQLPRYQLFELGGAKLRSFPSQEFRSGSYFSAQNDFLLASADIWQVKLRPLLYADWAFLQGSGRTGIGAGFQVYVHDVAVPALQFFAGYGFNPSGFAASAAVGPSF